MLWTFLPIAALVTFGISALVAASETAFLALKVIGAGALVVLGVQSILRARRGEVANARVSERRKLETRSAIRDGLVSGFANPKLAVFFVALFPQFVAAGDPVLPAAMLMAATIVVFDLIWYSALAAAVARAKRGVLESRLGTTLEHLTGTVRISFGFRLAVDQR